MVSVFWFRRDLRIKDHPALFQALASGDEILLVATADTLGARFSELSTIRQNSLRASWRELKKSLSGKLTILESPKDLVALAQSMGIRSVYVSSAFDSQGFKELAAIERDLQSSETKLIRGEGNYAVSPGRVRKSDGTPYRVYTPFFNEWVKLDPGTPIPEGNLSAAMPEVESSFNARLELSVGILAGEEYALKTLERFLDSRVDAYADMRNRADVGGTSHLSHALSHGEIHPRTILSRLGNGSGESVFRKEIAWREFYADVMWHNPETLTDYLNPKFAEMKYDFDEQIFAKWCSGQTGYPMVDAGMRQLLQDGWMHNRVRMIVASFLVKDLHFEWQHGAKWFEQNLTDFDPASNSHGWQWTAGCGTDASPYYRVFNPVMQGLKFDPNGDYVRKYIPELSHLTGANAHEPWEDPHGYSKGYPKRIVDHAEERNESLRRLEAIKTA